MIEHRTIWRCDADGCSTIVETAGSDPPPGWVHWQIERIAPGGCTIWPTICPEHAAAVVAVLPLAYLIARREHVAPGGGSAPIKPTDRCSVCGLLLAEVGPTCKGPP